MRSVDVKRKCLPRVLSNSVASSVSVCVKRSRVMRPPQILFDVGELIAADAGSKSAPNENVTVGAATGSPPPNDPNADISNSGTMLGAVAASTAFGALVTFGELGACSEAASNSPGRRDAYGSVKSPLRKYSIIDRTLVRARDTLPRMNQSCNTSGWYDGNFLVVVMANLARSRCVPSPRMVRMEVPIVAKITSPR